MNKLIIALSALCCLSCVTVGSNGQTYTVDEYGAPMEAPKGGFARTPTKEEMDPTPFRTHVIQKGNGINNSMIPRIQL